MYRQQTCDCRTISNMKVEINCHGRGLNISNVCGICAKIDHVQILDVGGNSLSNIPNACFEQCTELEELHLDSNNLTVLTKDAFTGLKLLKRLNVNNNSLIIDGRIHDPELFKPLKLLEELHIQKNMKSAIPETITYLSNVANGTLRNLERLYLNGLPNGRFGTNSANIWTLCTSSWLYDQLKAPGIEQAGFCPPYGLF